MQENKLQHKEEFQKLLENYRPSDESIKLLQSMKIIVLCGPTSAGRNTIIEKLVATGKYGFFRSDTTRKQRYKDGVLVEPNGSTYWFISEEQMLSQLKNGQMIEAAIIHDQQVSGVNIDTLMQLKEQDRIGITELQHDGPRTYKELKPDTIAIFILPPSFEEWIRRIKERSQMSDKELANRLRSSILEFDAAKNDGFFHLVINDEIDSTTGEIADFGSRGDFPPIPQREALDLLDELIKKATTKLTELEEKA